MKKISFILFVAALAIGSISAVSCSVGNLNFKSMSGIQGSGSAKRETRNVSGFEKIDASGAVNVEIVAGEDFKVEVEADDNLLQYVKTETSDDTLKIYSADKISPKTKLLVRISLPELTKLEVSGASGATATNIKGDSIELRASGASKIKAVGEIKDLNAEASGASTIEASNLIAENADVDSNGASALITAPINDLKAQASGASTVYYTGEPKNIKQDVSGASSIKRK